MEDWEIVYKDVENAAKNKMTFNSKDIVSVSNLDTIDSEMRMFIYNLIISRRGNERFSLSPEIAKVITDRKLFDMILDGIIKNYLNKNTSTPAIIEFLTKNVNKLDIEKMEHIYINADDQFKLFLRNIKQMFSKEFNHQIYIETNDETYLAQEAKDVFLF